MNISTKFPPDELHQEGHQQYHISLILSMLSTEEMEQLLVTGETKTLEISKFKHNMTGEKN